MAAAPSELEPVAGDRVGVLESGIPALVLGAACFSHFYADEATLKSSSLPADTVRIALRYGITAFDTSRYYGESEVVLGEALKAVADEFPRESYQIMTKCGRIAGSTFDYSPAGVRASVLRSLERLQTTYLDTVYLHDIEFVATPYAPRTEGNHFGALGSEAHTYDLVADSASNDPLPTATSQGLPDEAAAYGLASGDEDKVRGPGDEQILAAFAELRKLKSEGLVRRIGITGYPLPTLFRLAVLIRVTQGAPVDVLLSYCHLTLQNSTLAGFLPHLIRRAGVQTVLNASPFSMGLLTSAGAPGWHPAPKGLREAQGKAARALEAEGTDLADVALGYSLRAGAGVPLVVGLSNPREVHENVRVWREVTKATAEENEVRSRREKMVQDTIREAGFLDWSWASP
ncbi:Aldo/keto reductase family-domain-containing protein [Schizophyllum commune]